MLVRILHDCIADNCIDVWGDRAKYKEPLMKLQKILKIIGYSSFYTYAVHVLR